MNLWKPLQPSKSSSSSTSWNTSNGSYAPPATSAPLSNFAPLVPSRSAHTSLSSSSSSPSPLPPPILVNIFQHLPVPGVPSWSATCRAFAKVARDESGEAWKGRWEAVVGSGGLDEGRRANGANGVVASLKKVDSGRPPHSPVKQTPVMDAGDDFGDFSSHSLTKLAMSNDANTEDDFGDFAAPSGGATKASASTSATAGSLLDLDFDEPVPLPSSPTLRLSRASSINASGLPPQSHARRTSGFFALNPTGLAHLSQDKSKPNYLASYRAHHLSLLPLIRLIRNNASASSSSHLLSALFATIPLSEGAIAPTLEEQSTLLTKLLRFLSGNVQPTKDWGWLRMTLVRGGVADRFEGVCLGVFEKAEERMARRKLSGSGGGEDVGDIARMKEAALASWRVYSVANSSKVDSGGDGRGRARKQGEEARREVKRKLAEEWELSRVWVEKRELFYEGQKWDSGANITKIPAPSGTGTTQILDFTPMSKFIDHIIDAVKRDGAKAMEIFPEEAGVLVAFVDRIGMDVVAEYINPLLAQTRLSSSQDLYLRAAAACFAQAWRLVNVTLQVYNQSLQKQAGMSSDKAKETELRLEIEAVIYRLFETNMDEYLDEEVEWIKVRLEKICSEWDKKLGTSATIAGPTETSFLTSSNPDQVKRNVLAGFKDVLLLPVTLVPLTVSFGVNALAKGGTQAVNGLAMLNPQRWANQGASAVAAKQAVEDATPSAVVFDAPGADDTPRDGAWTTEDAEAPSSLMTAAEPTTPWADESDEPRKSLSPPQPTEATEPTTKSDSAFDKLQLLVSLDTALELIHADRESLKRVEAFRGYQGKYGKKVQETLEEVFILLLQSIGTRHIAPGFRRAINQMGTYQPAQHEETTSVAPLLQFFELVHIGDTIQSMVQVYFDKELSSYVDRTDFLNGVMQEKKRFEATLDDSVAGGLNAGIEVLMNQVEHIIQTRTKPGEYCPQDGVPLDLGPTKGCQDAISCLEMHCNLLRGSTSKEVLEVFYQEVGIRLQAILQKHMKRQIISLEGGFQMIADLNAYHSFVASLKQQRITDDFSSLKMLGHVYIVSDAKDLAQIIRDVTRYGGGFRPEDVYEFIQRRSDWKKIEKTVDKSMYALSVKEDCIIM